MRPTRAAVVTTLSPPLSFGSSGCTPAPEPLPFAHTVHRWIAHCLRFVRALRLKAGAEEIDMNMRRGLEAICGIVAGGLGLVTLVYVLFFLPAYTGSGSTCDSAGHCVDSQLPNKTIAEHQGVASLLPIIVVGVLLFVA